MEKRFHNLSKIVDYITEMDSSISKEKALEIAVQIQRNELLDDWMESISEVLNRIESSIDQIGTE